MSQYLKEGSGHGEEKCIVIGGGGSVGDGVADSGWTDARWLQVSQ